MKANPCWDVYEGDPRVDLNSTSPDRMATMTLRVTVHDAPEAVAQSVAARLMPALHGCVQMGIAERRDCTACSPTVGKFEGMIVLTAGRKPVPSGDVRGYQS